MIFPALHRFAKVRGLLDDLDFTEQTLHARLDLAPDGRLIGAFPLGDKKNPVKRPVSRIPARNSAAIAALGADTANRIIPGFDPAANKFAVQTQTLFLEQLRAVHATTPLPALAAVIACLERLQSDEAERTAAKTALATCKIKTSDWLTFTVNGIDGYLVEWPEIKTWWRTHCAAERTASAQTGASAELQPCMVTGEPCIPMRTHGARIKVAPGGLPGGVALVSSDKPAFSSYGFDKALVSPMSEEAVEAYIRAINWLGDKAHPDHHYRTADTIYLFWCDQPDIPANPAKAIENGDPALAAPGNLYDALDDPPPAAPTTDSASAAVAIHKAPGIGNPNAAGPSADATAARFYSLALSGSAARGIIRDWIDQPLPEALRNIRDWFEDITIPLDRDLIDPTDKNKDPKKRRRLAYAGDTWNKWPIWRLVSALQGKGDTSDKELARLRNQLWQCALLGRRHPVPLELIGTAVRRIATSGDCPPHRAALIQALLHRFYLQHNNPEPNSTMSDIENTISQTEAFLCGRLLRILESAQYYALGGVNATVVDKYYAAASATPGTVFGLLMAKLHDHLAKARKSGDPQKQNAASILGNRVADISAILGEREGFPKTFSPEQQGAFALGFYSEKLRRRKEDPDADNKIDGIVSTDTNSDSPEN